MTEQTRSVQEKDGNRWLWIPVQVVFGLLILLFNAPNVYQTIADTYISYAPLSNLISSLTLIPDQVYAMPGIPVEDLFLSGLTLCLYGLGTYMIGVLFISLRRGKLQLIFLAPFVLFIGLAGVPLVFYGIEAGKWLTMLLLQLSLFLIANRDIILTIILVLVAGIILLGMIAAIIERFKILGIIGLVAVGVLIYMSLPHLEIIAQIALIGTVLAAGAGVIALVYSFFALPGVLALIVITPLVWFGRTYLLTGLQWLWAIIRFFLQIIVDIIGLIGQFFAWLGQYFVWLADIIGWLAGILFLFLVYVFWGVIAVGLVALLGNLLLDDLRAAWYTGDGLKGTLTGVFGLGFAFSLLMMVSMGDFMSYTLINASVDNLQLVDGRMDAMGLFVSLIPGNWELFLTELFVTAGIPLFDLVLIGLILLVGHLGVLRGLFNSRYTGDFKVRFFSREALILTFGPPLAVMAVVLIGIMAMGSGDSE